MESRWESRRTTIWNMDDTMRTTHWANVTCDTVMSADAIRCDVWECSVHMRHEVELLWSSHEALHMNGTGTRDFKRPSSEPVRSPLRFLRDAASCVAIQIRPMSLSLRRKFCSMTRGLLQARKRWRMRSEQIGTILRQLRGGSHQHMLCRRWPAYQTLRDSAHSGAYSVPTVRLRCDAERANCVHGCGRTFRDLATEEMPVRKVDRSLSVSLAYVSGQSKSCLPQFCFLPHGPCKIYSDQRPFLVACGCWQLGHEYRRKARKQRRHR